MSPDTARPRETYRMFHDRHVGARLATYFRDERGRGLLDASLATLQNTGNLGAAALLFVPARLLPTVTSDRVATFAFGPGVTVEWGWLRRTT